MKRGKYRVAACLLGLVILLAAALPAAAETAVIWLFGTEGPAPADGSVKMSANTNVLATKFEVKDGNMVGFVLNDLSIDRGCKAILQIYSWNTDYDTTVSSQPLVRKLVETEGTAPKNETVNVPFDGVYGEGVYLATLRADGPMYLWTHQLLDGITCYRDGELYEYGTFKVSYLRDPDAAVSSSETDYDAGASISLETVVPVYGMGATEDGRSNFNLQEFTSLGQKFTVKKGKFTGLLLDDAVMGEEETIVTVWVYQWDTDYTTTIAGTPKYYGVSAFPKWDGGEHVDSYIRFDRAFAEGEYLVVFQSENDCSLWAHGPLDGVLNFMDGEANPHSVMKIAYLADPEAELDERPVNTPIPGGTPTPGVTIPETADGISNSLSLILLMILSAGLLMGICLLRGRRRE